MISLLLLLKLTIVLGLGALFLSFSRGVPPAARHFLSITTLAVSLLLPFSWPLAAPPALHALTVVARSATDTETAHPRSVEWLRIIWIAGAVGIIARFFAGLIYLKSRPSRAARLLTADSEVASVLPRTPVTVRLAPVAAPLVWGWWRPEILLPESASSWPHERIKVVLLHEMGHVLRGDLWTGLIATTAQALYWFHPLTWWLSARAAEEQELACDDRVLDSGASAPEYAALLVETARNFGSPVLFGWPMVSHSQFLRGRIMHILQFRSAYRSARFTRSAILLFSTLLIGAGLMLTAATDHPNPNQDRVYEISAVDKPPVVVNKVEPEYTQAARDSKIQGAVLLSLHIDRSGVPEDVTVVRSLDPGLDDAAIHAVQQWRFQAAMKDGQPVFVHARVEVNFRLK